MGIFKDYLKEARLTSSDGKSGSSETSLYRKLVSELDMEGIDYKKLKPSQGNMARLVVGDYTISSGGIFHDQWTVFEGKDYKEVLNTRNINEVLKLIS